MIFHCKAQRITTITILQILLLISGITKAEPYLAYKNNLKCMACHVNPDGGGLRNSFGRIYGQQLLPAKAASYNTNELAQFTRFLSIGTDSRFNASYQKDDNGDNSQSFAISSAQLYLHITLPNTGLSFYLDQQVAPGAAINREAFVLYKFTGDNFIKAGKLFLPYGLRLEDDTAFIRQATGMNFDNSDNGVEFGLDYTKTTINFFISNGTSQASNNDNKFLYGIRAEHLLSNFRVGATALLNDGAKPVQQYNIYGGANFGDFTWLTELDYLILSNANIFDQSDIRQLISLVEINYQWRQGVNFKFTAEYFDSDLDVDNNQQTRYSVVTEYTPFANIQLRLGYRIQDDIPQKPRQNNKLLFVQSHFYF